MKNKILKKIVNLFGYKLIEKKHVKNNRILSDQTILNINTVLKTIFENKNIQTIIQIGANDGMSFDDLNYFIKKYQSKSILVEPISEIFVQLKKNYKNFQNVFFENSAISVNEDIKYLFKVSNKFLDRYGDHISAISSFDKNHLLRHGVSKSHIIKEKVNTLSTMDLIKKYRIEKLDLFFVDAEGYDGEIVYDLIKRSNLRPIIIFEYIHIKNNSFQKLLHLFKDKNFSYFNIAECLVVFPNEEKMEILLN